MKIAIVDDDESQLSLLTQYITAEAAAFSHCEHQLIPFRSGEAFLDTWSSGAYDLIILDIFMGGLTGMDVAFRIRQSDPDVLLVFCTSSNEFASESYEVGAQHYLRKPVTHDDIKRMFQRLDLGSYERSRVIRLPDGHAVMLHDILYTDYENHVVTVHFKNTQPYRLRTRQSEIEELLLPCGYFCAPYKGVTVNFHAVVTLTNDTITLTDGTNIPLTRRKTKEVKEAYKKFCFQQMKKKVGV